MSNMVTHAMLVSDDANSPVQAPNRFILSGLKPFDQMKVILEQAIYANYLQLTVGLTTSIIELNQNISRLLRTLPTQMFSGNHNLDRLYEDGLKYADLILKDQELNLNFHTNSKVADLREIFLTPTAEKYWNSLYTPTITDTFLTEWLAFATGNASSSKYTDGTLYESAIYVPSISLADFREKQSDRQALQLCVTLKPVHVDSYQLTGGGYQRKRGSGLVEFLYRCNLKSFNIDKLLGIFASFALDHDNYVIANNAGSCIDTMADVCYDAITGSSYVSDDLAAGANIVDKREWVKFIQDKISANELQPVHDNRLFGEVLELLGVDTDIVNYFSKDIHQISAQEALAFRNSVYASVADDKFVTVGTEADTNNVDIDTTEGGDTDVEVGTDTDDADLGDDSSFDTPTEEDDKPADKVKPQIDPERMLLELAKPGASPLTDYLYRSIVAERIDSIIKQPPENARPNDILMLKRWRANWLYLVSVACLRDFLTRISLRLSK